MKLSLWLVTLALGLPYFGYSTAHSADRAFPAEGSTNYATYYTTQRLSHLKMDKIGQQWVQEMVGITRNTNGDSAFDNMSVRCVGYVQQVRENWFWTGACTETDIDGDKVFTRFDMDTHHLVGGTGKYEGISGSAPYEALSDVPRISHTRQAAVVHHTVNWNIQ